MTNGLNSVAYRHFLFSKGVRPPPTAFRLAPARSAMAMRAQNWRAYERILIRPEPGFYVMRLRSGAPLVPAIIYQICPMVIPEPTTVTGPHADDWCRPLDRSPRFKARVDGKRVDVELVWTARSLRGVSRDEFDFRAGPLWRWARSNRDCQEFRAGLGMM